MLFALKGFTSSSLENAGKVLIILFYAASLHGFAFRFDVEFSGAAASPTDDHATPLHNENQPMDGTPRKKRSNTNETWCFPLLPRTLQHIGNRYSIYIKLLFHFQVAE